MTGDNPPEPPPAGECYQALRERVSALAVGLGDDVLASPVGACPAWSVRDLLAHLTGLAADVAAGTADPGGGDAWTSGHVRSRRGRTVDELAAEWAEAAGRMGPALESRAATQIMMDAVTHEQDLRGAVGEPLRPPDGDLVHALSFVTKWCGYHLDKVLGLPPVAFRTELGTWRIGKAEPALTATVDALDLTRTLTGRRTWQQITALGWDGDPRPWRAAFAWGPFSPPAEPTEPVRRPRAAAQ